MKSLKIYYTFIFAVLTLFVNAQVPILNYSTNINGQVQLEIAASADNYYVLNIRHSSTGPFELATSMTLGQNGNISITEPLEAYPLDHYEILEYPIVTPADTDGDGIDDMTEFLDPPTQGPLNYAPAIDFNDGTITIDNLTTYKALSVTNPDIPWAPFLNDREFLKFVITDLSTDQPQVYFVNSETHYIHAAFMNEVGLDYFGADVYKGEIVYYPTVVSNNGTLGVFGFNYSFGDGKPFEIVQRTQELLSLNMPFLKNNLSFYVGVNAASSYASQQAQFDDSRVPILFEEDIFADIDYLALHVAEGFGFFRLMEVDETPTSRDVVLYESLPNTLPRVGGIMTSFIQTPLSHVNLRAIQDDLPNAFIRDPLEVDSIANLIGKYVYYRVDQDEYFIREASLEEVNEWFDDIRPAEEQIPALNLSRTEILSLDDITFEMSDGFGAKCTNVAVMRTFGFPEGTIPKGFGVPFYYYQEFMKYNDFFERIEAMIANPDFQNNLEFRIAFLKDLRRDIKDASMPQWMLDDLQEMHDGFPEGTAVRCRSSTNNEDLPGFSGAGLYTSKTQHLDEGHISKSIKQVYASMWNFRAYDEREFYRVDHYAASMGVLCHPNYKLEKANGVGVSIDPIYQTENTFYLNTQTGENLVTNPDTFSIPEEILLDRISVTEDDYIIIRNSNLVEDNEVIMTENYLDEMREFLTTIHDEFAILYNAVGAEGFAMDIEYKITVDDQLIIKQARPWASFWADIATSTTSFNEVDLKYFPNPVGDYLTIECDCKVEKIVVTNLLGQNVLEQSVDFNESNVQVVTRKLPVGMYVINGVGANGGKQFSKKFYKR